MTRIRRILPFIAAVATAATLVIVGPSETAQSAPRDSERATARANAQIRAILERLRNAQDPLNGRDGADGSSGRTGTEPGGGRDGGGGEPWWNRGFFD